MPLLSKLFMVFFTGTVTRHTVFQDGLVGDLSHMIILDLMYGCMQAAIHDMRTV